MNLRILDANGYPLRLGDTVILRDKNAQYYGVIERQRDFKVPMVRVLSRKYTWQSEWVPMGWGATQHQVLMHRKRYLFSRRLQGVYLQNREAEEYAAPLPYAM